MTNKKKKILDNLTPDEVFKHFSERRSHFLEEFDKKLEKMCRILMIRGYEQGKKQSKNLHNYTLDTDMAEKEWKHIKDFISKALQTQRAEIEKKNRKMYAIDVLKEQKIQFLKIVESAWIENCRSCSGGKLTKDNIKSNIKKL